MSFGVFIILRITLRLKSDICMSPTPISICFLINSVQKSLHHSEFALIFGLYKFPIKSASSSTLPLELSCTYLENLSRYEFASSPSKTATCPLILFLSNPAVQKFAQRAAKDKKTMMKTAKTMGATKTILFWKVTRVP